VSAFKRFSTEQLDALSRGRAIPFLIEHRGCECPGHSLSVIATIDDERFVGLFLPDAEPDSELVTVPLPAPMLPAPFSLTSDAADAHAIHCLWFEWNAGMRDTYLRFFALMGQLLARERLDSALESLSPPRPEDPTPKQPAKAKKRANGGAKPRNKRRSRS
jgi:hypothetical protein